MSHRMCCRSFGLPALVAIALTACEREPAPLEPASGHEHGLAYSVNSSEVNRWLAGLRANLARFHRFDAAVAAGYDTQITPCLELEGVGGMGFHYGDPDLIDGVVEEFAPELLLYEPQKNGKLRLVAVEYIVPFTAWNQPEPPKLHGLTFHANQTFQVWALHAWVWMHNPAGMFADWNAQVSCAAAN